MTLYNKPSLQQVKRKKTDVNNGPRHKNKGRPQGYTNEAHVTESDIFLFVIKERVAESQHGTGTIKEEPRREGKKRVDNACQFIIFSIQGEGIHCMSVTHHHPSVSRENRKYGLFLFWDEYSPPPSFRSVVCAL